LTDVTGAIAPGVKEPQLSSGWCRTFGWRSGFVPDRRRAPGTVVAGDWANADGGSGLDFADHGEHD